MFSCKFCAQKFDINFLRWQICYSLWMLSCKFCTQKFDINLLRWQICYSLITFNSIHIQHDKFVILKSQDSIWRSIQIQFDIQFKSSLKATDCTFDCLCWVNTGSKSSQGNKFYGLAKSDCNALLRDLVTILFTILETVWLNGP